MKNNKLINFIMGGFGFLLIALGTAMAFILPIWIFIYFFGDAGLFIGLGLIIFFIGGWNFCVGNDKEREAE